MVARRVVFSVIIFILILVIAFAIGRSAFWQKHFPPPWLDKKTDLQKRIYYGLVGAFKAMIIFALLCWLIFFMPEFWDFAWYLIIIPVIGFILGFILGEKGSRGVTGPAIGSGQKDE